MHYENECCCKTNCADERSSNQAAKGIENAAHKRSGRVRIDPETRSCKEYGFAVP